MSKAFDSLTEILLSDRPTRRQQARPLSGAIESLEARVLLSATATSANTAPTAQMPAYSISVDENADNSVFDLSTMFSDAEDTELTYVVQLNSNSSLVNATISGSTMTFDYGADQFGSAFIVVRATDSGGLYVESAFMVTVNEVADTNTAPTVANPIDDVTVDEDASDTVIDLSNVFSDAEDSQLTLSVAYNTNGALVNTGIDGNTLTLNYVGNQSGTAEITIGATDSGGKYVETTFLVTVNPVNDTPTLAGTIDDVTVDENADNTVIDLSGLFSDVEDQSLALSVQNSNGDLLNATVDGSTLTLGYAANQSGTASITVRGTDSGGAYVETTFQVTVNAVTQDDSGHAHGHWNSFSEHSHGRSGERHAELFARLFDFLQDKGRAGTFWGFGWRNR